MSIVHALVVDRYRGKIGVKNAVPDDYTKGMTIEIWLRSHRNDFAPDSKDQKGIVGD